METIPYVAPTTEIVETFDAYANSLDLRIAVNAKQTVTLTKLRDTLLPKLISGELSISHAEQMLKD